MAKLTLTDLKGGYLTVAAVNANYDLLETALQNTLSRDGTSPNAMGAQLDMNSFRLVNLVNAVNDQEQIRQFPDTFRDYQLELNYGLYSKTIFRFHACRPVLTGVS